MAQPESKLVRKIREYIHTRGGFTFKVHGSPYMMAGLPDIVCCYKGQFIGIEVKMPGNTASVQQRNVGLKIQEAKGLWMVAYDLKVVEEILDIFDRTISHGKT